MAANELLNDLRSSCREANDVPICVGNGERKPLLLFNLSPCATEERAARETHRSMCAQAQERDGGRITKSHGREIESAK